MSYCARHPWAEEPCRHCDTAEVQMDVYECARVAAHGLDGMAAFCEMTGQPHQLAVRHSAVWCRDCQQKIETCCEGAPQSNPQGGRHDTASSKENHA